MGSAARWGNAYASWGIGVYTEEVLVCDNVISDVIGYGILMSGNLSADGAGGCCIQNNTIRRVVAQTPGSSSPGNAIYAFRQYNFSCNFNRIEDVASNAINLDNDSSVDLSNITFIGNSIKSLDSYAFRICGVFVTNFYNGVVVQGNVVDGCDGFLHGRGNHHSIIGNTASESYRAVLHRWVLEVASETP